jgi:hypothetical protein
MSTIVPQQEKLLYSPEQFFRTADGHRYGGLYQPFRFSMYFSNKSGEEYRNYKHPIPTIPTGKERDSRRRPAPEYWKSD